MKPDYGLILTAIIILTLMFGLLFYIDCHGPLKIKDPFSNEDEVLRRERIIRELEWKKIEAEMQEATERILQDSRIEHHRSLNDRWSNQRDIAILNEMINGK